MLRLHRGRGEHWGQNSSGGLGDGRAYQIQILGTCLSQSCCAASTWPRRKQIVALRPAVSGLTMGLTLMGLRYTINYGASVARMPKEEIETWLVRMCRQAEQGSGCVMGIDVGPGVNRSLCLLASLSLNLLLCNKEIETHSLHHCMSLQSSHAKKASCRNLEFHNSWLRLPP